MGSVYLQTRKLLKVEGADAQEFLDRVLTLSVKDVPYGEARPGALLTPQGKIISDFLLSRQAEVSFMLEVSETTLPLIYEQLMRYRLRDRCTIQPTEDRVFWDALGVGEATATASVLDRRPGGLGFRSYRAPESKTGEMAQDVLYVQKRMEIGLAECGCDYPPCTLYPQQVWLDVQGGISTDKGCYVGQEVVARLMYKREVASKFVIIHSVEGEIPLPDSAVYAGEKCVGKVYSSCSVCALALIRMDVLDRGTAQTLTCEGHALKTHFPPWA